MNTLEHHVRHQILQLYCTPGTGAWSKRAAGRPIRAVLLPVLSRDHLAVTVTVIAVEVAVR
jgi:hypothetical protein